MKLDMVRLQSRSHLLKIRPEGATKLEGIVICILIS